VGAPLAVSATVADEHADRLLAAYDDAMARALRGLEEGYLAADGIWAERMRAAIARLLELASDNPELTQLCTVDVFDAGQRALEHRDRWMSRFMRLSEAGYAQESFAGPPTRLLPQIVAGGVFELIRSHAVENRLDTLADALPAATLIVLAPAVGRDEALRVAAGADEAIR
jgi:hypothetical protein